MFSRHDRDTPSAPDTRPLAASVAALLSSTPTDLSACNAAAGDNPGSQGALSGLARIFFYANAQALLVSH